jgi:hypothetical protein
MYDHQRNRCSVYHGTGRQQSDKAQENKAVEDTANRTLDRNKGKYITPSTLSSFNWLIGGSFTSHMATQRQADSDVRLV